MLKITGVCIVLAGMLGLGLSINAERAQHISYLKDWSRLLEIMENEIAFQRSTLPEICYRIGHHHKIRQSEFVLQLDELIKSNQGLTFGDCWKSKITQILKQQRLKKDEIQLLEEVGNNLQYEDHKMQMRTMQNVRECLEKKIAQEEKEKQEKGKITMCLSCVCGIIMTVILL